MQNSASKLTFILSPISGKTTLLYTFIKQEQAKSGRMFLQVPHSEDCHIFFLK